MSLLIRLNNKHTQTAADDFKPDLRNRVEKMFYRWNAKTGEKEELPILMFDCSNGGVSSLDVEVNDCVAVLLNYKGNVESFKGSMKGKTILLLGGCRAAPNSLGSLMIPLDEVDDFCSLSSLATKAYLRSISEV